MKRRRALLCSLALLVCGLGLSWTVHSVYRRPAIDAHHGLAVHLPRILSYVDRRSYFLSRGQREKAARFDEPLARTRDLALASFPVGRVRTALAQLIDLAIARPPGGRGLSSAALQLSRELAAAGQPYRVRVTVVAHDKDQADTGKAYTAAPAIYAIAGRRSFAVGETTTQVTLLARADRMTVVESVLGWHDNDTGPAVVLDRVSDHVLFRGMPALLPDRSCGVQLDLPDAEARDLGRLCAQRVHEDLARLLPDVPPQRLQSVAARLARRLELAHQVSREVLAKGMPWLPGPAAVTPPEIRAMLAGAASPAALAELDRADAALTPDAALARRILDELSAAYAGQVARHEAQHAVDGDGLSIPEAVKQLMPEFSRDAWRAVSAELSAYLAALAHDRRTTTLDLLAILANTADPDQPPTPELISAVLVLQGLCSTTVFDESGEVSGRKLAGCLRQLLGHDGPDRLTSAAGLLRATMFDD